MKAKMEHKEKKIKKVWRNMNIGFKSDLHEI
ncbi:hypothetical protein METP3_03351 [Methanosarcinales archaeon]|nr:hypothetical protein METP3_03351 [Methanosarcinales archaeon]